jgi:PGF-pre-PGF domain-containing protein
VRDIKSTVGIGPVLIGPENFITVGDIRIEPAWSGEPLTLATVPSLKAGTPMRIEFGEGDVTEIEVNATEGTENVVITLQQAVAKPADIPVSVSDHIYRYLHLATNVRSDINSMGFGFKVEKSWLHADNIDELTVTLNRFSGGEWEPLLTKKMGEDPTYVYYSAESPGLSVFAITGKEEVPLSEPVSWALISGLVVIMAIIGIVALRRRMH